MKFMRSSAVFVWGLLFIFSGSSYGSSFLNWVKVYECDANGVALYGSVDDLVDAIKTGASVRVVSTPDAWQNIIYRFEPELITV